MKNGWQNTLAILAVCGCVSSLAAGAAKKDEPAPEQMPEQTPEQAPDQMQDQGSEQAPEAGTAPDAAPEAGAPEAAGAGEQPMQDGDVAASGPGVGETDQYGSTLKKKPEAEKKDGDKKDEDKRVTFKAGFDMYTAYYSRGFRQETGGAIGQPWAEVGFKVFKWDGGDAGFYLGSWNSFHSKKTGASGTAGRVVDQWFESDLYGGIAVTMGNWSMSTAYMAGTSPNDAFTTCEEWQTRVSYDDSDLLGAWKLNPSLFLVVETGRGRGDGVNPGGTYLEPSIAPGFTWEKTAIGDIDFSFPVTVGLSLSNYYTNANGKDQFFGYASVGAKASLPLPINEKYGSWKLNTGVTYIHLNSTCKDLNHNDSNAVVGNVGVSVEF